MSNERWKTDGRCDLCRRKPYCTKRCTANKKAVRKFISEQIIISEKTGKAYLKPANLADAKEE